MISPEQMKDYFDQAHALASWFESQEIKPKDACVVMAALTATLMVEGFRDPLHLAHIIEKQNTMTVAFAALAVKAKG